jgi:peptidyl-prolyl cis-trans isomerase SurA
MMQVKFLLATAFIFCMAMRLNAQTLFNYGTKAVSSKSFIRAFNKNPGEGDRKKAMEEYLPLFINYTLKVQDAYDKKLDTLPVQKAELLNYKIQLAEGYMAEKAGAEGLIDEAIERMQEDVLLGHIYIEYSNGDTARAMLKANEAVKQLAAGKKWEAVALDFSSDEEARRHSGVIGWIGPFVIPYPYETMVYTLPKGGYTKPIPASQGVHIFSKRDTRPGTGTVHVAQLLLASFPGMTKVDTDLRTRLADSLYNELTRGGNFENMVSLYSQDRTTKFNNGMLPPFSAGSYDAAFEAQAFALKQPGDFSKPFLTSMGLHILKLVGKTPPPAKTDFNARQSIRPRLASDGRLEKARENYIKSKLPAMQFKAGTPTKKQLQQYTDSLLVNGDTKVSGLNEKNVLFSFGKQAFTVSDWAAFARVQSMSGAMKKGEKIDTQYDAFIVSKAGDYLPAHLDAFDTEFAAQYKEFKDANLLFEAMERNVWSKSMSDTTGLKKQYTSNLSKYTWSENVVAIMVSTNDSVLAAQVQRQLNDNRDAWRTLNETYEGRLYADSARYELDAFAWAKGDALKPGTCTKVMGNTLDGSFSFACILEEGKAGMQRTFEEARGYVVSDYQEVLENAWINTLKKKYPIKVNAAEWKKLLDQEGK